MLRPPRERLLVAAILILGFSLRMVGIGAQGFWVDEGHTLDDVTIRTLPYLHGLLTGTAPPVLPGWADVHPPLYFLSLMPWTAVAGTGEVALRLPSLWWSVLSIAVLFVLVRRLLGPSPAILAALVAALAPYGVSYAQEARMYALLGLEILVAVALAGQWLFGGDSRWRIRVGYVVAATAALYTHYFAGFCLLGLTALVAGVVVFGQPAARRRLPQWIGMQLAVGVLVLPWAAVSLHQWNTYPGREQTAQPLQWILGTSWMAANVGTALRLDEALLPLVATGWLAALGLWLAWQAQPNRRLALGFLAGMAILPVAAYFSVLAIQPHYHPRYIFPAMLAYYGVLGAALAALLAASRPAGVVATAAIATTMFSGLLLGNFNLPFLKDEAREVAQSLNLRATANEVVLVDAEEPLHHYYRGSAAYAFLANAPDTPAQLRDLTGQRQGAWLVQWWQSTLDSVGQVPFLLAKYGRLDAEEQWRGYRVLHYSLQTLPNSIETGETRQPVGVDFDPGVKLVSVGAGPSRPDHLGDGSVASGGVIWAAAHWQVTQQVPDNAKAVVQLVDSNGEVAAQDDQQLLLQGTVGTKGWQPGWESTTYHLLRLPTGLAPGTYRLQAVLYWKSTGQRLRPQPGRMTRGDAAVLGEQRIGPAVQSRLPTAAEMPSGLDRPVTRDLTFLGYQASGRQLRPGESTTVTTYWQATGTADRDYAASLVLTAPSGRVPGKPVEQVLAPEYPSSKWAAGTVMRWPLSLAIGAGVAPGRYTVGLEISANGGAAAPELPLFDVDVLPGPALSGNVPLPRNTLNASVGSQIELVGYDLEPQALSPGSPLRLALYWRASGEVPRSYTVFTQLLDEASQVFAQHDGAPAQGARPTSGWRAGEVIRDEHQIDVPRGLGPGSYRLQIGMYDPQTLERLPIRAQGVEVRDDALQVTDLRAAG